MKIKGWIQLIKSVENNDNKIELLGKLLKEQDDAKQILIDKGYNYTGLSLLETVKLLPGNLTGRI